MGYRPEIQDLGNYDLCFYGTKLYGYVKEAELPSYQYLISIGKVGKDDVWGYGFTHEMMLTADQFREFMARYEKDFDEISGFGPLSDYHDYDIIQKMLKSKSDKHLIWD